jgi:hypothetical protein
MVKWNLLRDAALRGHTEEALVRVVVPLHPAAIETSNQSESDVAQASALGKAVAGRIIRDLDRALPRGG